MGSVQNLKFLALAIPKIY